MTDCWYCHGLAFETWQSKFGDDVLPMPMCRKCAQAVRLSMELRDMGRDDLADRLDNIYGIETRRGKGFLAWIKPGKMKP